MDRRVVITGAGSICPLGNDRQALWNALADRVSGIDYLKAIPQEHLVSPVGGEARQFTGDIADYGTLDKQRTRAIKKGRKLMCREIEMGVAAAQLALQDAGLEPGGYDPELSGVVFGSDYIMTEPEEFLAAIKKCSDDEGKFHFSEWGTTGMSQVEPLWLLKYLPNMPASHIAIYNDLRGPSNSITLREASATLSVGEAFTTLRRGPAERMVAGSTGTRIHSLRTLHVTLQEQLADPKGDPKTCCRPFDRDRTGMVIGEGAGALILETLESAKARNATIMGEVLAHASTSVSLPREQQSNADYQRPGKLADYKQAFTNVLKMLLSYSGKTPDDIGHINAHGQSSLRCDREEAQAIREVFGDRDIPVVSTKSAMGNLGAGSGVVEVISSLMAFHADRLFPVQNYEHADPECPIHVVADDDTSPGNSFISWNITPHGQASGLLIARYE